MTDPDTTIYYRGEHLHFAFHDNWEFVTRPDASGVVLIAALTDNREVVLIRQYRPAVRRDVIELPAGLVGDGSDQDESTEQAARRELLEETGYEAGCLEKVCAGTSSPGLCDEIITFFVAINLRRTGPGGGNPNERENISVELIPLDRVDSWLDAQRRNGTLIDIKIMTGLYFLQQRS